MHAKACSHDSNQFKPLILNFKKMKTKRIYEKPVMQVFELKQQPQLLAGSGTEGSRSPYNDPSNWNWE